MQGLIYGLKVSEEVFLRHTKSGHPFIRGARTVFCLGSLELLPIDLVGIC